MTIIIESETDIYKYEVYETEKIEIESNCLFFKDNERFSHSYSLEEAKKITIE